MIGPWSTTSLAAGSTFPPMTVTYVDSFDVLVPVIDASYDSAHIYMLQAASSVMAHRVLEALCGSDPLELP